MSTYYEGDQVVEVTTDALHVRKTVEGIDRSVAELTFTIESVTGVPVDCRVVDSLQEGLTDDDVYLHRTADAERWSITPDGGLVFQGILASRTTVTNTVSVNVTERGTVESLFREPQIVVSRPMYASQVDDAAPQLENGSSVDDSPDGGATIVIHLADDRGLEGLSTADARQFREALGLESSESVQVKLGHLQQQVAELTAYSDELESFIDERGTGRKLLEELETAIDTLEAECESIRAASRETDDQLETAIDQLQTTGERVETLEEERAILARIDRDLASVTEVVTDLDARNRAEIDDVHEQLDTVETSLETTLEAELTTVRNAIATVKHDVDELATLREEVAELSALREEVDELASLREEVAELSVLREEVAELAALRDVVADLEDDVEECNTWRTSLEQALGAVTSHSPADEFEETGATGTETG